MKRCASALAMVFAALLGAKSASAQTYRLRADAFAAAATPSAGLIMLQGEARRPSWFDAEAAVWVGTGAYPADVLIAAVRARDPAGRGELRVGRMLASMGAIRPVHIDGADMVARAPWGTSLEVFGGMPVTLQYAPRDYNWAVGARAAQRIGAIGVVGVSYLQMRSTGTIAFEEMGFDAAATPARWLDGAFTGALDLARLGLTDARLSLAARFSAVRLELFAVRRSPSHLLPATSLFAALGDIPSDRAGGSLLWRAAPRLDVRGEGAIESLGGELGGQFFLRALLRLDDRGDGTLQLEVRRQGAPGASWTGVRGTARLPITRKLAASTELELAAPDDPRGRGVVWPWGLLALRFQPAPEWEMSGAVEASASPTSTAALRGLLRVARAWRGP
jgi:hypothetical protein